MRALYVNGADSAIQAGGGGDSVQMRETAACLRQLGVEVELATEDYPSCAGFDVLHLFNVEMSSSAVAKFRYLKSSGLPILVSPIFWDQWEFTYGGTIVEAAFGPQGDPEQQQQILDALAVRNVRLGDRWYATLTPLWEPSLHEKREVVAGADMILVSGQTEAMCIQHSLGLTGFRWREAVCGIHREHYETPRSADFDQPFVLFTGRWLDPKKNVLLLAEAMRELGYPLVVIGDNQPPQREAMVRARLPKGTEYIGRVSPERLAPWYFSARVHVLPSWYEIPGIVSIEAAAAGTQVVCSNRGSQVDYFGPLARYVDPFSVASIREGLRDAWESYDADRGRRTRLRRRALSLFTWQRAARQTLAAYREVLGGRGQPRDPGGPRKAAARSAGAPR